MKKKVSILIIVIVAVALCAFAVVRIGGELSLHGARRAWSIISSGAVDAAYTLEPGLSEVFADVDKTLIAAGGSGFAAYGTDGREIARVGFSMKSPTVSASSQLAAVYDLGSHTVRVVYPNGAISEIATAGEITSVFVGRGSTITGRGGHLAICTAEASEYKGLVSFYEVRSGIPTLIYKWFSGEGYVLGAAIDESGKRFAVNTFTPRGGRIVFLNADSEDIAAEYICNSGAILDITFDKSGALISRTLDGIIILDRTGAETSKIDFEGRTIDGYATDGDGFIAIHFTAGVDSTGALVTYNVKGVELGRLETSRRLFSLTTSGNRVAVLWNDGLDIFDRNLRLVASYPDASGMRYAFPRGGESAVVTGGRNGRSFAKQST